MKQVKEIFSRLQSTSSKLELKPCPFCGGKPELRMVGDYKQYYAYFCSKCCKTPVKYNEAQLTEQAAKKIWNRRVDNG